ncbi:hypothetical protein ACVWWO_005802 [Bradyrhizobium sp. F1.13.1]
MCGRQGLLQGREVDIRRLGRSHRHLPLTQSRFRYRLGLQLHPLSAEPQFQHPGNALLRAPEQVLGVGRRQCRCRHAPRWLRRDRFRRRGSDGELGGDQLIQSAHAAAQPGTGPHRSRSSLPRRAILVAQRADQVGHRSSRRRCARRDRLRIRPGISCGTAARAARLAGHRTGVQAGCVGRECPDRVLRRQRPGCRHTRHWTPGRAEPEPSGQSDRSRRQLLQQPSTMSV